MESPSSSSLPPYKQPGSKLLPLSQIPSCSPDTRVRFLGWYSPSFLPSPLTTSGKRYKLIILNSIASYDMATARLSLFHPPSSVLVKTDVSLLTSSLSMGALRNGEWVNVIGDTQKEEEGEGMLVRAVTLWSAGGINLGKYEKGMKGRLEADASG
ncbi:unnamed protein product [Tuber aestivum]|uniref:Uncharacterized protein n=1 Tax=Tuber aestivum TaxID=59557 RepID=A0A292Q8R7_9PEZI|nr:unnamed protein product [Tuber aestivum]